MDKSNLINKIGLACFIFAVGVIVGEHQRGRGPFFTSWYGNDLYYSEHVKIKNDKRYDPYKEMFGSCKNMTIIGLQAIDNENEAWVLLDGCTGFGVGQYATSIFNQESLEKK